MEGPNLEVNFGPQDFLSMLGPAVPIMPIKIAEEEHLRSRSDAGMVR